MNLKEFVDPPKQYRPSPFWSWNGKIEPPEVENRIRDMKTKGFGGFFMHSRSGLSTAYMDDDWMRAIRRGVEVARELKMESWLYDEDRWPSGVCGGKTTEQTIENLAMALTWVKDASSLKEGDYEEIVAWTQTGENGEIKTLGEKPENTAGAGVFVTRRFKRGHFWYNGENYVDLLNPQTIQDFIDKTHERYAKLFRYDFGEYMPGIFTDEPNVNRLTKWFDCDGQAPFSFPWTPGFAEYFEKIHGYSPLNHLAHLLSDSDEGFKFRHDFWTAVNERFIESFTIPISKWCSEHEFKLTGHYLYEDDFYPMISSGGSVMSHYEYMDVPGIDHLGRNINNPWTIKQVSSVANQMGKKRVICEIFGCSGHSMSYEDMKWIADYNCALGVTFFCQHLVQYSMTGDRKRDFPPTFSYHQPYWDHIRVMNDYLARISWSASQGRSAAKTLVLMPVNSAYGAYNIDAVNGGTHLKSVEDSYHGLIRELLAEHISFDLGDERIIGRHGALSGKSLTVGNSSYSSVILPYSFTWKSSTLDLLESFEGTIIVMGDPPKRVNGAPDDRMKTFLSRKNVIKIPDDPTYSVKEITANNNRDVSVTLADGSQARNILVNHRTEASSHVLFLVNTDRKDSSDVTVTIDAIGGVVELDAVTGRAYRYASDIKDGTTIIHTTIHPAGSRIFLIDQTQTSVSGEAQDTNEEPLDIEGPYTFQRIHENILTIDRCSLEIDGKKILTNEPVWKARNEIWKYTGIDEYKGYQPWKLVSKNIRTRTNKTVLTFTFNVKDIPERIELAMENADRFTVEINGNVIEPTPGSWHIDRKIPSLDLKDHVVEGINTITASTDFLWDTEIEDIYIAGDFAIGSEEDGFPIMHESETLNTGSWVDQGYPFYSGSMIYKMEFDLESVEPDRYEIDISGAKGSIFYVVVNDTEVGAVAFSPFRGDITGVLKEGTNTVEIEVFGTLRNTLGPLHHIDGDNLDWTGPEQFIAAELTEEQARVTGTKNTWTDKYNFAPYGFIEPPKLIKISPKKAAEQE